MRISMQIQSKWKIALKRVIHSSFFIARWKNNCIIFLCKL
jgi:hypothetical protein